MPRKKYLINLSDADREKLEQMTLERFAQSSPIQTGDDLAQS